MAGEGDLKQTRRFRAGGGACPTICRWIRNSRLTRPRTSSVAATTASPPRIVTMLETETLTIRCGLNESLPRLQSPARVLDIGCGNGVPATRLLAERFDVIGVDISEVQIAELGIGSDGHVIHATLHPSSFRKAPSTRWFHSLR